MTVVNPETGELVEPLNADDAKRLTERIRLTAGTVADSIDKLMRLVHEARAGQAHLALGYPSWTTYVSAEFTDVLPRLAREPRRELVSTLAETGMSVRAIAPVVGIPKSTVHDDLSGVRNRTPDDDIVDADLVEEPRSIIGRDGKTYLRTVPPLPVETAKQRAEREIEHGRKITVQGVSERIYHFAFFDAATFLNGFHEHESKYVAEPMRLTRERVRAAIENLTELEKGLPS